MTMETMVGTRFFRRAGSNVAKPKKEEEGAYFAPPQNTYGGQS
jgi:hypothetical protein